MRRYSTYTVILLLFVVLPVRSQTNFYPNGQKKATGELVEGKKTGKWVFFYPNGVKQAVEYYQNDELHGLVKNFDFDGNLLSIENWHQGLIQDSAFYYFPSGQLEKQGLYKNGQYDGYWTFYHPNGTLKRKLFYYHGAPNGEWKYFNDQGVLIQEGKFINGKESGEWKFFNDKGRLEYIGSYAEGKRIGQWYKVSKSGKKKLIILPVDEH